MSLARGPRVRHALSRGYAFLASLRLALVLLVLLTVAAILGGVLPQAPITPNAEQIYRAYGVYWYRVITRLGLDDVFHGPGFLSLVGLFALNLALCTARRARRSFGRVFGDPRYVAFSGSETDVRRIDIDADRDTVETVVRDVFRRHGMRRIDRVCLPAGLSDDPSDESQLVARRWRWGLLAPDLLHAGILIILLGALLGGLRQEGTFVVSEWEKGQRWPACSDDAESNDCIPLAYDLRIDDFGAERYPGSSQVKTFWADLAFLDRDEPVRQGRIAVNRPLSIDGFSFYPWRYGDDVGAASVRLHVVDRARDAVVSAIELRIGETVAVPGRQLWVTAARFYQTFALTDDGEPVDLGAVPGGHSAVLLQITGIGDDGSPRTYRDLALPFLAESDVVVPQAFLLVDAFVPAFLEIHYARNPGYPVVWWGFVLLMVGLAGAFYFVPSQIWVSIRSDAILLRGEGRKAMARLGERLDRIEAAIRLELGPESESERTKSQEVQDG